MATHIALEGVREIGAIGGILALIRYEFLLQRERKVPELREVIYSAPDTTGFELPGIKSVCWQNGAEQSLELVRLAGEQRQTFGKSLGHDVTSPRWPGPGAALREALRPA